MRIEHLINGKTAGAKDYFETVNPATHEVLAEVARGGEEEVHAFRGCVLDDPSPDRPEIGVFLRLLRQICRDVDHAHVRKQLPQPLIPQRARNRLPPGGRDTTQ